jgi:hypothetical protein
MNLQEFITESLVQIAEGIREANNRLNDKDALVNPRGYNAEPGGHVHGYLLSKEHQDYGKSKENPHIVQSVAFDVAVAADQTTTTEGGGKLRVVALDLGAERSSESKNHSESRIRFTIPMVFPSCRRSLDP